MSAIIPRVFRDGAAASLNPLVMAVTVIGWLASFLLMARAQWLLNGLGVLLCAQSMVWAAYLIHEAAHQALFAGPRLNRIAGEVASFIAGSSYASFERIRRLHIRHHLDRADLCCFDYRAFIGRRPRLCRVLQALEWAYIPATEVLMHLQVIWRPLLVRSQRAYLPRAMTMLALRAAVLVLLAIWSLKALLLYCVAYALLLHALNFFDCFHHSFENFTVTGDEPIPMGNRDRGYEQANTYSNLISVRHPWLNLLILNFAYHNAHHHRASLPWYRLPRLHRQVFGTANHNVLPMRVLLANWHRFRVLRVTAGDYGAPATGASAGAGAAAGFVGAHGVSFLTVI
jgi:fatty acid desaturase